MPLLPSSYTPPLLFAHPHVQTIFPTLFRRISVAYERETIPTPDGDVLDIDRVRVPGATSCIIVTHGLEGSSRSPYVMGMVRAMAARGIDVVAWNFRGCGGRPNRTSLMYHSGATYDLHTVVSFVDSPARYDRLYLAGFSLGGNMMLKYLGENVFPIPASVSRAVAFSVPCDLAACSDVLARPANALYMKRFLKLLRQKVRAKMDVLPGTITDEGFDDLKNFRDFDDRYTAPIHGFRDADDYWHHNNCKQFLGGIRIPTLLVNAADDPFLSPSAFPTTEAEASQHFYFEQPAHGGHCGFIAFNPGGEYWSEQRAAGFLLDESDMYRRPNGAL